MHYNIETKEIKIIANSHKNINLRLHIELCCQLIVSKASYVFMKLCKVSVGIYRTIAKIKLFFVFCFLITYLYYLIYMNY